MASVAKLIFDRMLGRMAGTPKVAVVESKTEVEFDPTMLDRTLYYVDKDAWRKGWSMPPIDLYLGRDPKLVSSKGRDAYWRMREAWNLRTSGSGHFSMTILYALRAHMRGKVHCHDMTYETQAAWLTEGLPFLCQFLRPKDRVVEPAA